MVEELVLAADGGLDPPRPPPKPPRPARGRARPRRSGQGTDDLPSSSQARHGAISLAVEAPRDVLRGAA